MHVENVEVVGLQLAERVCKGDVERFGAIPCGIRLDDTVMAPVRGKACCVFCGDNHLVAQAGVAMKPFSDPALGLLILVIIGRIDEVAALRVEEVEEFEDGFFSHSTHHATPGESISLIFLYRGPAQSHQIVQKEKLD